MGEKYDPEKEDLHDLKTYPKTDSQRNRLRKVLEKIVLFRGLDSDQIALVLDCVYEVEVKKGSVIIQKGEEGDNFYVIEEGEFGISLDAFPTSAPGKKEDQKFKSSFPLLHLPQAPAKFANVLKNEGYFGELALMYNVPRSATVIALTDGLLWVMDRRSFRSVVLHAAYKKRQQYEDLISNMPVLTPLDGYDKMRLADALIERKFPPNQAIFRAGEKADGMYFLVSGKVRITLGESGSKTEREIRQQEKGSYFGEAALLNESCRTANVYATDEPVTCAFVDKESFERLLGPCNDLLHNHMSTYKFSD